MICDGAARNSALATMKRLRISHSSNPPSTERVPARYLRRAPCHRRTIPAGLAARPTDVSIDNLGHPRQEQAVDGKIGGNVAELAQRIDDLAGRLEQFLAAEEVIGLLDIVGLELAHVGHDLNGLRAIALVIEPADGLDH